MSTSTYLSNASVTVNSVDLSDQVSAANITRVIESLESTAFGQTNRSYVGGLENSTVTVTFYNSFAATETYATLKALVGTQTIVKVKPTSSATGATNPEFTLTNCYLETLPLINAAIGALDTFDVVFTGGAFTVAIA